MARRKGFFGMLKAAFSDFSEDDCTTQAAALSYYTVFSLPPLLVLIILVAGVVFDPADVQHAIQSQFQGLIGPSAGQAIESILVHAQRPEGRGLTTVLGVAALVFGAGGAFLQLQAALNRAWEVKPDPKQGGIRNFLVKRLFSLAMVMGLAFLLLVSLAVSALLSALGGAVSRLLPGLSEVLLLLINHAVSLVVTTALFATIFRYLPDAEVRFRDVWVGALVTAVLFEAGKFAIGFYLGQSNPGQAFGAAGSLALVLVWIYYSSMLVLFGSEFTQVWATERGQGIEPEDGAVRVIEETREVRPGTR
jgi:membrane protein